MGAPTAGRSSASGSSTSITQCGLPIETNVYASAGGGPSPGRWSGESSEARPASISISPPTRRAPTGPLSVVISSSSTPSRRIR